MSRGHRKQLAPELPIAPHHGCGVAIGGAGGLAALGSALLAAEMVVALPFAQRIICAGVVPVLGVPVQSKALNGMDSLLSIAQMPGGIPVGTLAIGHSGAINAALFAASILALGDADVAKALAAFRRSQTEQVLARLDPRAE